MGAKGYRHWALARDAHGIAWASLDRAGAGANTLAIEVLEEFDGLLAELSADAPSGLVIRSAKPSGFIAGADVHEIAAVTEVDDAERLVRRVQAIFDRLEALPFPTLALIKGFCLGGGVEFALACRHRIAEDSPATRLGLPEVMLGFHPGWGGTVRLTRLIGAPAALDLILSGRTVDARRAKKLGLVDHAVPERLLEHAARQMLLGGARPRRPGLVARLSNQEPARSLIAPLIERKLRQRARREHYPAPFAALELWRRHGGDRRRMQEEEARSAARLALGETAQNLIRVFMLRERLRAAGKETAAGPVRRVHVVGAGTMGGDIAAWCALRGLEVSLQDRAPQYLGPAIARAHALFARKLKQRHLVQGAMDRLMPDPQGYGAARADLVIEAVIEDLGVKTELFQSLEARARPEAILATNTSSIPLEEIAAGMSDPKRLVGLHFFNPVAKMQLVEVVRAAGTARETIERAAAFVRAIDRLPLPVRSAPGFLVNRLLMPYLMEAVALVAEGVAPEAVDEAARRFGMPLGPVELADTVGLDICLSVARVLTGHFGGEVPGQLEALVAAGKLGRKSGAGFYSYAKGRRTGKKKAPQEIDRELAERMVMRLLNEAQACLEERVVEDADLLDAGMVYGAGFAPFRGGPMHYLAARGREQVLAQMLELAERHGERFQPHPALAGG